MLLQQAKLEAELQESHARSVDYLALARERHGRAESNIGLFEERISEITRNRSLALKDKVEALQKLLELYQMHGEFETQEKIKHLQNLGLIQKEVENEEKLFAKATSESNNFLMNNNPSQSTMGLKQQTRSSLL